MNVERVNFLNEINGFVLESKSYLRDLLVKLNWSEDKCLEVGCELSVSSDLDSSSVVSSEVKEDVKFGDIKSDAFDEVIDALPKTVKRSKEASLLDILAKERNSKRKPVCYKGRIHTKHKSHNEILREVIAQQMEAIEDAPCPSDSVADNGTVSKETPVEMLNLSRLNVQNPHLAWKYAVKEAKRILSKEDKGQESKAQLDDYRHKITSRIKEELGSKKHEPDNKNPSCDANTDKQRKEKRRDRDSSLSRNDRNFKRRSKERSRSDKNKDKSHRKKDRFSDKKQDSSYHDKRRHSFHKDNKEEDNTYLNVNSPYHVINRKEYENKNDNRSDEIVKDVSYSEKIENETSVSDEESRYLGRDVSSHRRRKDVSELYGSKRNKICDKIDSKHRLKKESICNETYKGGSSNFDFYKYRDGCVDKDGNEVGTNQSRGKSSEDSFANPRRSDINLNRCEIDSEEVETSDISRSRKKSKKRRRHSEGFSDMESTKHRKKSKKKRRKSREEQTKQQPETR